MDTETIKPLIFGNKKTNKKSKIGFVRASMTSVPSVEVAQIPQNQTYLQVLSIIFISQQFLFATRM